MSMEICTKEMVLSQLAGIPAGQSETVEYPGGQVSRTPLEGNGRGRAEEYRLSDWGRMRLEWYEAEQLHSRHDAEPGYLEISCCVSGRLGWQLRDGSGLYLGPGGVAIRRRESCSDSRLQFPLGCYAGIGFSVDTGALDRALPGPLRRLGVTGAGLLEKYCADCRSLALPGSEEIRLLCEHLVRQPREARAAWGELRLQELLLWLWQMDLTGVLEPAGWPREQLETIHAIHSQLTADPARRYTIEELSRQYLINTSALKAGFKAVYGQPVAAYMREYRMREAARLLRETDRPVAEIAAAVGYENQGKFTRAFKEATGLLPTAYRRL